MFYPGPPGYIDFPTRLLGHKPVPGTTHPKSMEVNPQGLSKATLQPQQRNVASALRELPTGAPQSETKTTVGRQRSSTATLQGPPTGANLTPQPQQQSSSFTLQETQRSYATVTAQDQLKGTQAQPQNVVAASQGLPREAAAPGHNKTKSLDDWPRDERGLSMFPPSTMTKEQYDEKWNKKHLEFKEKQKRERVLSSTVSRPNQQNNHRQGINRASASATTTQPGGNVNMYNSHPSNQNFTNQRIPTDNRGNHQNNRRRINRTSASATATQPGENVNMPNLHPPSQSFAPADNRGNAPKQGNSNSNKKKKFQYVKGDQGLPSTPVRRTCPIPGCNFDSAHEKALRYHFYRVHAPFNFGRWNCREICQAIKELVQRVFGQIPLADVFGRLNVEVPTMVGMNGHDAIVIGYIARGLRKEDRKQYPILKRVVINPPCHAAVLAHWTWLLRILVLADEDTQRWFATLTEARPRRRHVTVEPQDCVHGGQVIWESGRQKLPGCCLEEQRDSAGMPEGSAQARGLPEDPIPPLDIMGQAPPQNLPDPIQPVALQESTAGRSETQAICFLEADPLTRLAAQVGLPGPFEAPPAPTTDSQDKDMDVEEIPTTPALGAGVAEPPAADPDNNMEVAEMAVTEPTTSQNQDMDVGGGPNTPAPRAAEPSTPMEIAGSATSTPKLPKGDIQVEIVDSPTTLAEEDRLLGPKVAESEGELSDGILYEKSEQSVSTSKSQSVPSNKVSEGNRKAAQGYADAHFHFDLLAQKMGMRTTNLTVLLNAAGERVKVWDHTQCPLQMCIANFCHPDFYPSSKTLDEITEDPRIKATFGIHPTQRCHVVDKKGIIHSRILQQLDEALYRADVVGFGEVGLDWYHEKREGRARQEDFLRQLLKALGKTLRGRELPIVLHLRHDSMSSHKELATRARKILRETVGESHPIQLHCFSGTAEDVEQWMEGFPNTYFSLAVGKFQDMSLNSNTAKMVRSIPMDRLLLETDSPFLMPNKEINIPFNIVNRARKIALMRECDIYELLDVTLHNTARLFKG